MLKLKKKMGGYHIFAILSRGKKRGRALFPLFLKTLKGLKKI
jgi:hypothetical protein